MVPPAPHPRFQLTVSTTSNQSLSARSPFPWKRDFASGDNARENTLLWFDRLFGDRNGVTKPAKRGLCASRQEISSNGGVRGGAERTQTTCQACSSVERVSGAARNGVPKGAPTAHQ